MLAYLLANDIILGNTTFDKIPTGLKPAVAKVLIDNGCEVFITDPEYLPTDTAA